MTRVAYASDPSEVFGDFSGLEPWNATPEPAVAAAAPSLDADLTREEIRRVVLEELRELVRR
jgi:hypothetical protein